MLPSREHALAIAHRDFDNLSESLDERLRGMADFGPLEFFVVAPDMEVAVDFFDSLVDLRDRIKNL